MQKTPPKSTSDFVVVGAGAAACALIEALTRDGRTQVTVVEAGGPPTSPFIGMPAGFGKLFRTRFDWGYWAQPHPVSGHKVYVPRGRMLGGSSNLNAQIVQWGHPADFDGWEAAGAKGWGWNSVAPVLRAMEAARGEGRGSDGPLPAERLRFAHDLTHRFVAAARRDGQPDNYNGGDYEGAWISEVGQKDGVRFSAWRGLLKPALSRNNLRVLTHTRADAIEFNERRATGVRVQVGRNSLTLSARRGVVLCAGAFGSPHLLMRSGVGPARHLKDNGVAVVQDAPGVGENLHDHPMACLTASVARADTLKSAESPGNLARYMLARRGPLASNVAEAVAFERSSPALVAPDVEFLFAPVEWRDQGLSTPTNHAFTISCILLAPKSRGRVSLCSADAEAAPLIDLALLTDDADRQQMIAAVRRARAIAARAPLASEARCELAPGPGAEDDLAISAWLDRSIQTVYHPGGTCRMGADDGAVVDQRLAVKGLDGLWVADASVMPAMVRGHPHHATVMIGARAADFLKAA